MLSKRLTLLSLLPLSLAAASCSSEENNYTYEQPDGMVGFVEPDGTTEPPTFAPQNQSLTLTLTDPTGSPVDGATILVETDGDPIKARSDASGKVVLELLSRIEILAIHIFHREYAYTSVFGASGDELVISLEPMAPPQNGVRFSTVAGQIRGWELLPRPVEGTARVAMVVAAGRDIVEAAQSPRPGTVTPDHPEGTDFNWAVDGDDPFPSWLDYQLRADVRATALVALAGTFTLAEEPILELTHLGLVPSMSLAPSAEIVQQDVELTHALDHKLEIVRLASSLEQRTGYLGLVLEDGAIVTLGAGSLGDGGMSTAAPGLFDALETARYWSAVDLRSKDTVAGAPRAQVFAERSSESSSFTFDGLLEPPGRPSAAGRTLAAAPAEGAEVHRFSLYDGAGALIWSAYVQGNVTRSVELPEIPVELEDRVASAELLEVTAFDVEDGDASMVGLEDRAKSWSVSRDRIDM